MGRLVLRSSVVEAQAQAVGSLAFPGGASVSTSGAVRIPRNGGESINVGASEFTIEFFFRPSATDTDNDNAGVSEGNSGNYSGVFANLIWDADIVNTGPGFVFGIYLGQLCFAVNTGSAAFTRLGTSDTRDGLWHHGAVYYNPSSGLAELFVDGNREDSSSTAVTGDISHPGGVGGTVADRHHYIGKEKAEFEEGFDGDLSMTHVSTSRLYNGATYTVPTSPIEVGANTVGLYYFDENTGTTLGDSSGDGNDGTLVGSPAPTWSTDDPF